MIQITKFNPNNKPEQKKEESIINFLHHALGTYGDPKPQIQKAVDYALGRNNKPGGILLTAYYQDNLACVIVSNKTGMSEYIPENILVYIATDAQLRGKGIGKRMIQELINTVEGDIALHVEPNNPAKGLYEKLGFSNKYLEMRFSNKA